MESTKDENTADRESQERTGEPIDALTELRAKLGKITRIRFRVKPDYMGRASGIALFMMIIILAGSIVVGLNKDNEIVAIVAAAVVLAVVAGGIALFIAVKAAARKKYYCCYVRDESGIFCMSEIGKNSTVFTGGTAYRAESGKRYTLGGAAYAEWLDGEGTGIFAAEYAESCEYIKEENVYVAHCREGGLHEYAFDGDKLVSVKSRVPVKLDSVDPSTGKAKVKYERFEKVDPTYDFKIDIPDPFRGIISR